uniref:NADH-ubiquinone oxidoreductase chain 4L n=1 Tax=Pantaleon erectonodatus TaxID=3065215 RepID=A0AA95SUW3_9HEMI|nr:NADH dehydrogenase subunit 4L [Pantaleon erectonodatus]WKZ08106.1 NADH dehydrogenase subunit 4L [Pantaleon erectonodatus]
MINFFFFFFLMGVLSLSLVRKHIFLCLISLEFIIIYLLLIFYFYCLMFFSSLYFYVIFLTFCVCEGVLGLSLIVLMIRCHSNDYLNSIYMW